MEAKQAAGELPRLRSHGKTSQAPPRPGSERKKKGAGIKTRAIPPALAIALARAIAGAAIRRDPKWEREATRTEFYRSASELGVPAAPPRCLLSS